MKGEEPAPPVSGRVGDPAPPLVLECEARGRKPEEIGPVAVHGEGDEPGTDKAFDSSIAGPGQILGMGWSVRPYRDGDFEAVLALERVRDPEGYASTVTIRQAAALWPATFLVADEDGEVVGFAIGAASADPAIGWVLRLKVRRDRRRRGIATVLIGELVSRLGEGGVRDLRLTVAPENAPALALYRRWGFEERAVLPGYFGPGEDRLVLARRL